MLGGGEFSDHGTHVRLGSGAAAHGFHHFDRNGRWTSWAGWRTLRGSSHGRLSLELLPWLGVLGSGLDVLDDRVLKHGDEVGVCVGSELEAGEVLDELRETIDESFS